MWCTGKDPREEAWVTRLRGRDGAGKLWVAVQVVHCTRLLGPGGEWGLRCRSRLGPWLRAARYGALDLSSNPIYVTWSSVPRASFPPSVKWESGSRVRWG